MKNIYQNLFLNIIYILAIFFLLSSRFRLLLTNFLINLVLFDKVVKKSFFFSFKANANIDSYRFFATKLFSISISLTDFRFG